MKKKKFGKKILALILVFLLGGIALVYYIGPRILLVPTRVKNTAQWAPEKYNLQGEYFNFKTKDQLTLSGYLSKAFDEERKGVFLLCHGIGSCKEHQFGVANFFNRLGYDVLSFDSRAHGQSEGEFCTYGYKEKQDIVSIINQLEKRGYQNFFIYGASLGGGIALQTLAIEPRLKGGIIVSTFSNLDEVSFDYQKRITKIPWKWVNNLVNKNAGKMAGFQAKDVNPEWSCQSITQPVMMIHGEKDERIDVNCAKRNFKALASQVKTLELIPDGYHNNAWQVGGDELTQKMIRFIEDNF